MELDLHSKIIEQFKLQQEWTQSFAVPHHNSIIDLQCACGPQACTPINATKQPSAYPRRTVYRFDKKFHGESSREDLCNLISESLPGSNYTQIRGAKHRNRIEYHCSCNRTIESLEKKKEFVGNQYKQADTKVETVKKQKTAGQISSLDRMSSRQNQNSLKLNHNVKDKFPSKRMTSSNRASSQETRCHSTIVLFLGLDKFWYLDSHSTNLQHTGHVEDLTPKRIGMNEIDDTQSMFIQRLSSSGFAPSQITKLFNIMEETNNSEIDNKTVSNLLQKVDLINHDDMNVNHDMSSADKAIRYLSRFVFIFTLLLTEMIAHNYLYSASHNISHSVVYDDPELGLCALSNPRGRPNLKNNVVQLNADEKVVTEVMNLREEMSFAADKKLVLIVSFATDEMIRETMKFPEVNFIDCTGRANRQKRDLFLSVIRSALGRCHISNVSIMPSGECLCSRIYLMDIANQPLSHFPFFYGEITTSSPAPVVSITG